MKKQARQMIGLLAVLIALVAGYVALKCFNEKQADQPVVDERTALMQLNEENIVEISYDYDGETYAFKKGEDAWHLASDPDLSLSQYQFETMASYLAELRVEETVGETSDLSQYGLNAPQKTINFKTAQEDCTVLLGDYNSMASGYYICLEGENAVYMVSSNFMSVFNYSLDDLVETVSESDTVSEGDAASDGDIVSDGEA